MMLMMIMVANEPELWHNVGSGFWGWVRAVGCGKGVREGGLTCGVAEAQPDRRDVVRRASDYVPMRQRGDLRAGIASPALAGGRGSYGNDNDNWGPAWQADNDK